MRLPYLNSAAVLLAPFSAGGAFLGRIRVAAVATGPREIAALSLVAVVIVLVGGAWHVRSRRWLEASQADGWALEIEAQLIAYLWIGSAAVSGYWVAGMR